MSNDNANSGSFFLRNPPNQSMKSAPSVTDNRIRPFSRSSFFESDHSYQQDPWDEGEDSSLQGVDDVIRGGVGSYTEGRMRETYQINHKRRLHSSFERLYEGSEDEIWMETSENHISMTRSQPALNKSERHSNINRPFSGHHDISLLSVSSSDSQNQLTNSLYRTTDSLKSSRKFHGTSQTAERQEHILTGSTHQFHKIKQRNSSSSSRHSTPLHETFSIKTAPNKQMNQKHHPVPSGSHHSNQQIFKPPESNFKRTSNIRNTHSSRKRESVEHPSQVNNADFIPHFSVPLHECTDLSCQDTTPTSFHMSLVKPKSKSNRQNNCTHCEESKNSTKAHRNSTRQLKSFESVNSRPSVNNNNNNTNNNSNSSNNHIASQQMTRPMTFTTDSDIQRRSFMLNRNHNSVPTQEDEMFHLAQSQRTTSNVFTSHHVTSAINMTRSVPLNLNKQHSMRSSTSRMLPPEVPPRIKQGTPYKSQQPIVPHNQPDRQFRPLPMTPSQSDVTKNHVNSSRDVPMRTKFSRKEVTQWNEKSISNAIEDLERMYESLNLHEDSLMEKAERRDFTSSIHNLSEVKPSKSLFNDRYNHSEPATFSIKTNARPPQEKAMREENMRNGQRRLPQPQTTTSQPSLGFPSSLPSTSHHPHRKSTSQTTHGVPYYIENTGDKSKLLRAKSAHVPNPNDVAPQPRNHPSFSRVVVIRGRKS